jgi:hypothetical protein
MQSRRHWATTQIFSSAWVWPFRAILHLWAMREARLADIHPVSLRALTPGNSTKMRACARAPLGNRSGKEEEANPAGSRRPRFQIDGTQNRPQSLVNTWFFRHDQRFNRTAVKSYSRRRCRGALAQCRRLTSRRAAFCVTSRVIFAKPTTSPAGLRAASITAGPKTRSVFADLPASSLNSFGGPRNHERAYRLALADIVVGVKDAGIGTNDFLGAL